ncbi:MAG: hypothetical protein N2746_09425 [Deltaproteobacteria bacterium]|nr:hypothetical protein [Deltaproteobacteria bacterium]
MRISLKDFGGFLSSADLGRRLAVSVLDSIRKEPDINVIVDFSGVQGVNKHFCEEFLDTVFRGIGYEGFKKKVILQNQTAVVKMVFDSVIVQKRGIEPEGITAVIGEPIQTVHVERKAEEVVHKLEEKVDTQKVSSVGESKEATVVSEKEEVAVLEETMEEKRDKEVVIEKDVEEKVEIKRKSTKTEKTTPHRMKGVDKKVVKTKKVEKKVEKKSEKVPQKKTQNRKRK